MEDGNRAEIGLEKIWVAITRQGVEAPKKNKNKVKSISVYSVTTWC
jgi:hypothetical protein